MIGGGLNERRWKRNDAAADVWSVPFLFSSLPWKVEAVAAGQRSSPFLHPSLNKSNCNRSSGMPRPKEVKQWVDLTAHLTHCFLFASGKDFRFL